MANAACMLCLAAAITLIQGAPEAVTAYATIRSSEKQQRLAVVVPAYHEDLQQAVSSLKKWPVVCSHLTQHTADLVLYYAEGREDHGEEVNEAVDAISQSAGKCFRRTRAVYGNLDKEEVHLEEISSVLFYKMFLDQDVSAELAEYNALAIIAWDMLVASSSSFEELYKAAFATSEEYWVKGSINMEGMNFHNAPENGMRNILGYINGNAIYNNDDPEFVEYAAYTQARWHYIYPYDVALWLTISDIPGGRSLSERFTQKFAAMNLISRDRVESNDDNSESYAAGNHALFIQRRKMGETDFTSRSSASEQTKRYQLRASSRNRQ